MGSIAQRQQAPRVLSRGNEKALLGSIAQRQQATEYPVGATKKAGSFAAGF